MSLLRRMPISAKPPATRSWVKGGLFACGKGLFLMGAMLATAGLVFVSFPRVSHSGLAWVAWVPFLWAITKIRGFWASFFFGWLTAFLFHAGLLYWVYYTCLHGGGLSVGLSLAAWLGLCAILSFQYACFGGSCYFFKKAGYFFAPLAACAFVTFEWLHQLLAFYGLGFPWLIWGYSQWNVPAILQVASYTGVYGISFILMLVNGWLGWACSKGICKKSMISVFSAAVCFFGAFVWGARQIPSVDINKTDAQPLLSVRATLMQPNIDQYKKWDESFEQEIVDTLRQMGSELEGQDTLLTVWPESALPGKLLEERYARLMADITQRSGAYQVLGSAIDEADQQFVGAYLIEPSGVLQAYKKIKLVPFGEYFPAEKWVRKIFPQADVLGLVGTFIPGDLRQPLLNAGGVLLGTTICYEAIFPQVWRWQNKQGAKLFVNLTNDAWFFDTAAPYQHLAANVLRAAETRRFVLRAANTGFSAVIDPFGRILQRTDLFVRTSLSAQVPLQVSDKQTLYTRWGDWFAALCAVLFFTSIIPFMVFAYD